MIICGEPVHETELFNVSENPGQKFNPTQLGIIYLWKGMTGRNGPLTQSDLVDFATYMSSRPDQHLSLDQVNNLVAGKIPAIKVIREVSGLGLYDAKIIFDKIYEQGFKVGQSTAKPLDQKYLADVIKYLETLRA